MIEIQAQEIIAGEAQGRALVTREPLSFWGGYDADRGEIIDRRHERSGEIAAGRVLVLPFGRGSSTASGILLQAMLNHTAPAALISLQIDPILALGVILGEEMFSATMPVLTVKESDFALFTDDHQVQVHRGGRVVLIESMPC